MMQVVAMTGGNFFHQLSEENEDIEELARVAFVEVNAVEVDLQSEQNNSPITEIACGGAYNLVARDDGSLVEWGTLDSIPIARPHRVLFDTKVNIVSVACGRRHALALTTSGDVYSWGLGLLGRLGHGNEKSCTHPRVVSTLRKLSVARSSQGTPVRREWAVSIGCGSAHSGVIMNTGRVFTWGSNRYSQCGGSPARGRFIPTLLQVPAADRMTLTKFAGGRHHSALLSECGNLFLWGAATGGRLGTEYSGPVVRFPRKIVIATDDPVRSVAVGDLHTLALTRSGMVYAWGINKDGQCGTGNFVTVRRPTPVLNIGPPSTPMMLIAAGANHSLAIGRNGSVYCWGYGESGLALAGFALPPSTIVSAASSGSSANIANASGASLEAPPTNVQLPSESQEGEFQRTQYPGGVPLRVQARLLRHEGRGLAQEGTLVPPAAVPMLCHNVVGHAGARGQGPIVGGNLALVKSVRAKNEHPGDDHSDGDTSEPRHSLSLQSDQVWTDEDGTNPGLVDPRFVSQPEPVHIPVPTGHHAMHIAGGGCHTMVVLKRDLTHPRQPSLDRATSKSSATEPAAPSMEASAKESDQLSSKGSVEGEASSTASLPGQVASTPTPVPGEARSTSPREGFSEGANVEGEDGDVEFEFQRTVEGLWLPARSDSTGYEEEEPLTSATEASDAVWMRDVAGAVTAVEGTVERSGGGGGGGGAGAGAGATPLVRAGSSDMSGKYKKLLGSAPSRPAQAIPTSVKWRAQDKQDLQLLFHAARHGRFRVVEELCEAGCPLTARDGKGNTALIVASQNNYPLVVDALLCYGALPSAQNNDGNTALHFAIKFGYVSVQQLLLQYGASETTQNKFGLTPYEGIVPGDLEY